LTSSVTPLSRPCNDSLARFSAFQPGSPSVAERFQPPFEHAQRRRLGPALRAAGQVRVQTVAFIVAEFTVDRSE